MKKCLQFSLILVLLSTIKFAYAETVTWDSIITPDDLTIPWINGFKNTVVNAINSFPGENIQAGTITYESLDANTTPVNRWNEAFNDFVYTGLLPPTSASLTSITTAGTAYIYGMRVVKDATSKDYTASKDTYVDLSNNGTYTYSEVALGAAAPVVATNSIRLAKVVTDATTVASVTDLRVTGVSLGTNDDFYIKGMELLWTAIDRISLDSGVVYSGVTRVGKTTTTGLNIGTASDYITGASERGVSKFLYVYSDNTGSIKLDDNAPDYHDIVGNTVGKLYYYKYGTAYWRVLGAVRLNATGSGNVIKFNQRNNTAYYDDVYNNTDVRVLNAGTATTFTAVDCSAVVPAISTSAYLQIINSAGATFYWRVTSTDNRATSGVIWSIGAATEPWVTPPLLLNSARSGDYIINAGNVSIWVYGYIMDIRN